MKGDLSAQFIMISISSKGLIYTDDPDYNQQKINLAFTCRMLFVSDCNKWCIADAYNKRSTIMINSIRYKMKWWL